MGLIVKFAHRDFKFRSGLTKDIKIGARNLLTKQWELSRG